MTASDGDDGRAKAANAFRTISEVAEDLDVPQHVLRFWETKFAQVKPMKRAGGRRYYRPDDVVLLQRIRDLLYAEGFTIRGVQKVLRERGVRALIDGEAAGKPDGGNGGGAPAPTESAVDDALDAVAETPPSAELPGLDSASASAPGSTGDEGTVDPDARRAATPVEDARMPSDTLPPAVRRRLESARARLDALRRTLAD